MTPETLPQFLAAIDAGADASALMAQFDLGQTRVYELMRQHRPDRKRKPRRAVSDIPAKVRALAAPPLNTPPKRIAWLLKITDVYVYRILRCR